MTVLSNLAHEPIVEFAKRYVAMGFPHNSKRMTQVFCTDTTTSVLVWEENEFMVECYFIHPNVNIPAHAHPFENLAVFYSGLIIGTRKGFEHTEVELTDKDHGKIGNVLGVGEWHLFKSGPGGAVIYNISRWKHGEEKNSATVAFDGPMMGPIHQKLLDSYKKV